MLNAYITRVQAMAQSQAIDNDILVYWPLHDYWMNAEGFEKQLTVHARDWLAEQPIGKISRRLLDDGYAIDFISEKQLATLPAVRTRDVSSRENTDVENSITRDEDVACTIALNASWTRTPDSSGSIRRSHTIGRSLPISIWSTSTTRSWMHRPGDSRNTGSTVPWS